MLPDGWESRKLEEVCRLWNGRAYKKEELLEQGKYLVLRVGNFFTSDRWYYSDFDLDDEKYCDDGDLLYAWSASFGPRIWSGGKVIFHYHIWKIAIDDSLIDKHYLFHFLDWDAEQIKNSMGSGSTMIHVTKGAMEQRTICLPPLDEQRRIAEVLRSVDAAIAAAQEVVDQARSNLEAATSALVGSDSSTSDWSHGRCDSFFVLQRGFDITEAQATPGPYRVISSSGPSYSHSAFAVEAPAVITGRKGRLGTVFYSDEACWPHDTALWVKDFKGNNPRFVYWKLRQMDLKAYDAATSVPTLNRNNVHALEIAFPPLAKQIDLSETLDAMLLAIEGAESQLVALQTVKSSVSRDLLSGHVRVPE